MEDKTSFCPTVYIMRCVRLFKEARDENFGNESLLNQTITVPLVHVKHKHGLFPQHIRLPDGVISYAYLTLILSMHTYHKNIYKWGRE